MIPGAFERRAGPAVPLATRTAIQATDHAYPVVVSDRERLVYEREGGGAPSNRSGGRPAAIFRRLFGSRLPRGLP
jgi:hypothetical protein